MSDEYAFVVAAYVDLAAADADYSAVHQLFSGFDTSIAFDAVTVGRKASGEIRFGQRPAGDRSPDGPSWSLAEGLAAALFPSVGADAPTTQLAAREILSAVSGEVSRRLGRDALRDLGAHLDGSAAAPVVAAAAGSREPSWRGTDQGTFGDDANRTRRCCPDRPNESIRAADRVAPTRLMRHDRVADVRVAVLSAAPQSLRYPRIRALATASCRPWTLSLS